MIEEQHFTTLNVIPRLEDISINDARKLFFSYKEQGIVVHGLFDDDFWQLSDEYSIKGFNFKVEDYSSFGKAIGVTEEEYKSLVFPA